MEENTPLASDGLTTTLIPVPEQGPLTGLYFLSTTEPRQGQFLSPLGPEHYLVQLFDPGATEPSLLTKERDTMPAYPGTHTSINDSQLEDRAGGAGGR